MRQLKSLPPLLLLAVSLGEAALPPGFDEELYCPPGSCLRDKEQPDGWVGPASSFHECYEETSGDITEPQAWGEQLSADAKSQLLRSGYTRWVCNEPKPRVPLLNPLGEDTEWPRAEMFIFLGVLFAPQWMTLPLGRIKHLLGR
jgi:hypothetical protein